MTRHNRTAAIGLTLAAMLFGADGHAANEAYQSFFFTVCNSATGQLGVRCDETDGGMGDLSSDSESSLNPSQTLASSLASTLNAAGVSDAVQYSEKASDGALSLLLQISQVDSGYDRNTRSDLERGWDMAEQRVEVGVDLAVNNHVNVGLLLHREETELDFDRERPGVNFTPAGHAGRIDTERVGTTLYLAAQLSDAAYVDASFSFSELELDTRRRSIFQESNRVTPQVEAVTRARTDGQSFAASINAGYTLQFGVWSATPYVGLSHTTARFDDYAETDVNNSGLAMEVAVSDEWVTVATAGISISRAISFDGGVLVPQFRAQYLADLARETNKSQVAYINDSGSNTLSLTGDDDSFSRLTLATGLVAVFPHGWNAFLELQHVVDANDFERTQIAAGLRHNF